ncbi:MULTISPECIES: carbohydrate ABC transporter permease [unclassified Curtobacterium]|uniref:carbohydrate ABC transporter permease n=1 Tax=unclassified Curtobacterium TaxID=257496 RepID=UPI000DAAC9CC|nr:MULTISPECIES: sugar ABC transporter permease [unclassified Curtobacterium]PZE26060.1 sugar ABC transporter permease [Curtobacterium sp. MCBD17_028]PZF63032.1 sugar ABC transporter permease [Curtobacterium sp. MCBD17_013]WIB67528.1 sugar ABC transporter permease [Curtobacterium sp. MCBD17_035]
MVDALPRVTAPAPAVRVRTQPRRRRRRSLVPYLYVLPAFVVFAVFLGWPFLQTVQYSFFDWDGLSTATWAGFANYVDVVQDAELRGAFLHALVLMVFYCAVPVALALFLTALISRANALPGMSVFRTVLFLPQVIASVVVATIWVSIYSTDGLLNQVLRLVGLGGLARVWLGDYGTALPAIGFVGTWLNVGLCLVLFLSGVGNIAPALFEAARLDGAGAAREFFSITLPSLRGQIAVALTLTIVSALKTFDLVYITTRGGPGNSTTVPAFEAYNRAFNTGQVGAAAAVAVTLTVVIMIVTALVNRIQPKDTE